MPTSGGQPATDYRRRGGSAGCISGEAEVERRWALDLEGYRAPMENHTNLAVDHFLTMELIEPAVILAALAFLTYSPMHLNAQPQVQRREYDAAP